MPLTGDFEKLHRLVDGVASLARGTEKQRLTSKVRGSVRTLLNDEFRRGVGPDGTPWKKTVRGLAALVSRKLAQAWMATLLPNGVRFTAKTSRDILDAHQQGETFAARAVASHRQFSTFDKLGRMVRTSRALNKKGEARRGVTQTYARAHHVGPRVLPARPSYPTTTLPDRWAKAVGGGLLTMFTEWQRRFG